MKGKHKLRPWQLKMHEVIFEADTPGGKAFDVALLIAIIASVLAAMLESIHSVNYYIGRELRIMEWAFTIIFTIEYFARILSIGRPLKYMTSFLGIIDLMSIIPTYLSLVLTGAQSLIIIRAIRLLRVYRILKLSRHLTEANVLIKALRSGRFKITVFLTTVMSIVLIMGTLMYLVEGEQRGFTSIPISIYWAVITLTTVGYGDIVPQTFIGQTIATFIMIIGYSIIAVPTGIVSAELIKGSTKDVSTQACQQCGREGHDVDAQYCKYCGEKL
jgi:voltage-gated potassium channel